MFFAVSLRTPGGVGHWSWVTGHWLREEILVTSDSDPREGGGSVMTNDLCQGLDGVTTSEMSENVGPSP